MQLNLMTTLDDKIRFGEDLDEERRSKKFNLLKMWIANAGKFYYARNLWNDMNFNVTKHELLEVFR